MPDPFTQMLHDWQNFYVLSGTAAATLIGLVFIAATFGASAVTSGSRSVVNTWVTPIIIHFGSVLLLAVLIAVPTLTSASLGLLLTLGSLVALVYVYAIARIMIPASHTQGWMWKNAFWHVILPGLSHLLVLSTSVRLLQGLEASLDTVAIATAILLVVGIRNAWDLTIWIAQNQSEK